MNKADKKPLELHVYQELKTAILQGRIPLKVKLSEEQLADAFKVSRTPIRAVLKRLQYEKMVQIIPNKGAFINQPTKKEIEETLQVRTILEAEAIRFACKFAKNIQLSKLEELTFEEENLYRCGRYSEGILYTSEFHQGLIDILGNKTLSNYSRELINITNVYLAYNDQANRESPLCPKEHRGIIQAIRQKNETLALEVFHDHFNKVIKNLDTKKRERSVSFKDIFNPYDPK